MQYLYSARVMSTGDGDTLKLDVELVNQDLGFHVVNHLHMPLRFRLFGLDTPPKKTPAGAAAADFLADLLPVGTDVHLDSRRNKAGADMPYKYGDEWMAVIFTYGAEVSVNELMIRSGHALPWDGKGPRPGGV